MKWLSRTSVVQALCNVANVVICKVEKRKPVLIETVILPNASGTLQIYSCKRLSPSFKFVYCNGYLRREMFVNRLLMDRKPLDELASGIHDNRLIELTGYPISRFTKG